MSSPHSMGGAAAAADIAGEKLTECIHYTLSGDPETDLVTGIVAVIHQHSFKRIPTGSGYRQVLRVLNYLTERFKSDLEYVLNIEKLKSDEERARMDAYRQMQTPSPINSPMSPIPYTTGCPIPMPGQPYSMGGMTSDGVGGYPIQGASTADYRTVSGPATPPHYDSANLARPDSYSMDSKVDEAPSQLTNRKLQQIYREIAGAKRNNAAKDKSGEPF